MGGNKSKPFVDVSSKVISRFRPVDVSENLVEPMANFRKAVGVPPYGIRAPNDAYDTSKDLFQHEVANAPAVKETQPPSNQEADMSLDPAILAEISKWSSVKSSPNAVSTC